MTFTEKLLNGYYSKNTYEYVSHKEAKSNPAKAAQLERYQADGRRRHAEFQADAFEELNITNHPKAGLLFEKAWIQGHGNGYSEVWYYMQDLVDLIL